MELYSKKTDPWEGHKVGWNVLGSYDCLDTKILKYESIVVHSIQFSSIQFNSVQFNPIYLMIHASKIHVRYGPCQNSK
jgi:hypothetical protein